ncbi:MAG: adenylyl-sulfate kinase [Nannocystaceae bacterium]
MTTAPRHIQWQGSHVTPEQRREAIGQRGCVVWLTGLSGAGKSTVALRVERRLLELGRVAYTLDGDNVRHGLCSDLGFTPEDRQENIRRVGEVVRLMADAGVVAIVALISPYRADRAQVRARQAEGRFVEVFVDAPLAVCENRDPKGLYAKARAGVIPNFTGISAPYEAPLAAELTLETAAMSIDDCVDRVVARILPLITLPDPA